VDVPQAKRPAAASGSEATPEQLGRLRGELERQRENLERAEHDRDMLSDEVALEHALLDAVVRQMPAGLAVVDAVTGQFVLRNDQASLIWGRDPSGPPLERFEELRGRRADGAPVAPDEWPLARAIQKGEVVDGEEILFTRLDDTEGIMEVSATPVRDAAGHITAGVALLQDVTERRQTEERLRQSEARLRSALEERELLLREARHEVRNNLQVITSLLGLQARNDEARKLLQASQSRIQAMAQAHEQIGDAPDLTRLDLDRYVRRIVDGLSELYSRPGDTLVVTVEVEPVQIGLDATVKCGLVVNELVSNALRHAFADGRAGRVTVALRGAAEGDIELVVSDDGVGLPEAVSPATASTLGLPLADHLVRQLGGTLQVESSPGAGATFRVRFSAQTASPTDSAG